MRTKDGKNMNKHKLTVAKMLMIFRLLAAAGGFLQVQISKITREKEVELNDSWRVQVNKETYDNVDLSEFRMPETKRGSFVILRKNLGEQPFEQAAVRMQIRYSAVWVYIDGALIYKKNAKLFQLQDIMGSGYIWARLPECYKGKELKIVLLTGEKNAFTSIEPIALMESSFEAGWLVLHNITTVIVAMFLLLLGILIVLGTFMMGIWDSRFQILFFTGAFSISISSWMLISSRVIQLISTNFVRNVWLEYNFMFLAAIFLLCFVAEFMEKRARRMLHVAAGFFFLLSAVLGTLNDQNIVHYCKTGVVFHFMALMVLIPVIVSLIRREKQIHRKAEHSVLLGNIFFLLSVVLELIRYRYNKFCPPEYQLTISFVPIGALIFILLMLEAFCILMMQRAFEDLEKRKLYEMAYLDALTGLHNRAWCEKVMQEYQDAEKPVSIINMDLNFFKRINDTYGHAKGDELLIHFGEIIKEVFKESACVGRMGGDEFIVILDAIPEEALAGKIKQLVECVKQSNESAPEEKQISTAFGYASNSDDVSRSVWKVYEEADHKMYDYKQKHKMSR